MRTIITTNNSTLVASYDLPAGIYEVTLATQLLDTTGAFKPSDFITGVLKNDTSVGTGPASIVDGIPIAVWGTHQIKVEAAKPRIWFKRSDQTEKDCIVYVNKLGQHL